MKLSDSVDKYRHINAQSEVRMETRQIYNAVGVMRLAMVGRGDFSFASQMFGFAKGECIRSLNVHI